MKIEEKIIKLIKILEEADYTSYICGEVIWKHILGKRLKEYKMITSAPSFFLLEKPTDVKIEIDFNVDKFSYLNNCSFQIDQLLYHPKYGILDEEHILSDVENRILKINRRKKEILSDVDLLRGLVYHVEDSFQLELRLEKLLLETSLSNLTEEMQKYVKALLLADLPGKIFLKYSRLFSNFISLTSLECDLLDYLKKDIRLRLTALLLEENLEAAISFMNKLSFSREIKESVIHLLKFHTFPLSSKNLKAFLIKFKERDIDLWFSINRAKEVNKKQLERVYELDDLEKAMKQLIEKKEYLEEADLKLQEDSLAEIGYSQEERKLIMKKLLSLVKEGKLENSFEVLLSKAKRLRQEEP